MVLNSSNCSTYVIGDRLTDIELAKNLGAKGILINDGSLTSKAKEINLDAFCELTTTDWKDIYKLVSTPERKASNTRKTKESNIKIEINLDSDSKSKISTGIAFFDHMLDQLSRHGNIDLTIETKSDLHIDEHHTIEDTALALGEAFITALGKNATSNVMVFVCQWMIAWRK